MKLPFIIIIFMIYHVIIYVIIIFVVDNLYLILLLTIKHLGLDPPKQKEKSKG